MFIIMPKIICFLPQTAALQAKIGLVETLVGQPAYHYQYSITAYLLIRYCLQYTHGLKNTLQINVFLNELLYNL